MNRYLSLCATTAAILIATSGEAAPAPVQAKEIVLVHGAVVDGSGWRAVHDILVGDGYRVSIVQHPLTSLDADVAATRRVLDQQTGPVVLVGHSYGGAVITVAGADPKVRALVYVAAFQPDVGESVGALSASMPLQNSIRMTRDSLLYVDRARFREEVAADLPESQTSFLAASQVFTSPIAFAATLPVAAWRDKPSYGIVASEDKTIDPNLERFMYKRSGASVTEIRASHMVHLSQPQAVAAVIKRAARDVR